MKQKELINTFMMILKLKNPSGVHGLYENNSDFWELRGQRM